MKYNNLIKFLIILSIVTTAFGLEWKSLGIEPRRSVSMIVDSLNQRIILFGGTSMYTTGRWYSDVWEMSLDSIQGYMWHKLPVSGTPPAPRCDHSAVYDSRNQRMIVFGGWTAGGFVNDVWALNLTIGQESWVRLNPSGTPPVPRYDAYTIYHPRRNSLIIFGGTGHYTRYGDVWELKLDRMVWQEITVSGNKPAARGGGGEMFDRTNNRMIIFGGSCLDYAYNEVWALDLTLGNEQWTQLRPTGYMPAARSDIAYGSDPRRGTNKFYVFAGWTFPHSPYYNDLYVLDLNSLVWTRLNPTGDLPEERRNPTGVYDFFNDNFFVFGGDFGGGYYGETFYINLSSDDIQEWQSKPMITVTPSLFVNSTTTGKVRIRYILPKTCNINLKILDTNGRIVRNLFSGKINSESDWLLWDMKDNNDRTVSSGVYYCFLETEDTGISKKFVIAK
ncbi:MAG: hypothetical protein OEZ20_09710 [candidate division WOR-3 bacterium]|nr:hypothetical protein [candidate division WOR-3 bacterium]